MGNVGMTRAKWSKVSSATTTSAAKITASSNDQQANIQSLSGEIQQGVPLEESDWKLVTYKRNRSGTKISNMVAQEGVVTTVESKSFSLVHGYGFKSWLIRIQESKGNSKISLWVTPKGLAWISAEIKREAAKVWTTSMHWERSDQNFWLILFRGKNKSGEFLKFTSSNNNGGVLDLFFPSGKNLSGWSVVSNLLDGYLPKSSVPTFDPSIKTVQKIERTAILFDDKVSLSSIGWDSALTIIANDEVVWDEICRSGLCALDPWLFRGIYFKISAWSPDINALSVKDFPSSSPTWVLISGVPFNLWNDATFKTLGARCGGLIKVSESTLNGWCLSSIKLQVKGPVPSSSFLVSINYKSQPFDAVISKALVQSDSLESAYFRSNVHVRDVLKENTHIFFDSDPGEDLDESVS